MNKSKHLLLSALLLGSLLIIGCQHEPVVHVSQSGGLIIYEPDYTDIRLTCEYPPNEGDEQIIFSCSAAFTAEEIDTFAHSNIVGDHVCDGVRHGHIYTNERPYDKRGDFGLFSYRDGEWHFLLEGLSDELDSAALHHGTAFAQYMIIFQGDTCTRWRTNTFKYRALCEHEGKLKIVESAGEVEYATFVDMLLRLGVTYAIYLDMGGWDDSWYRGPEGQIVNLNRVYHPYLTNWLTFRKEKE